MKRILMIIGILVSVAAARVVWGQNTDGVINYEMKVNLHRRIPAERESMKAMIPEYRSTKHQLFFNANESLYKPVIEDDEEEAFSGTAGGGGNVQIRMRNPNEEYYTKPSETTGLIKREFFGKDYLIQDTLKIRPWKFGTDTKEIQGYTCKQAYYTDESQPDRKMEVTAWYTDQLRANLGPERYSSLPGAILAVDINNGERVIVARGIEFRSLKKNEMKVPSSGQKVTEKEFRKIADEQMKQMGGRGGMIIRN